MISICKYVICQDFFYKYFYSEPREVAIFCIRSSQAVGPAPKCAPRLGIIFLAFRSIFKAFRVVQCRLRYLRYLWGPVYLCC